jgi:hypothetical protein
VRSGAVGYANAGAACGGAQETVTASVQDQYDDRLDLGGVRGLLRPGEPEL